MPIERLPELLQLPRRERLEIAERLWLSAVEEDSLPVADADKRLIDERLAAYRGGKIQTIPHVELMRRVRSK